MACGFSVDTVDQKAIEDLGVFNWPGLERRVQDFADAAVSGKLKMVYVKSGSATIEDGEDSADISAGQMVMIDDKGETRWSKISEEGLVLLSCETVLAEEGAAAEEAVAASAGQFQLQRVFVLDVSAHFLEACANSSLCFATGEARDFRVLFAALGHAVAHLP